MSLYALAGRAPNLHAQSWVADSASVIGAVVLEKNASVWFGCVLRGDNEPIVIGEGSNVQDGAVLHTDIGAPLTLGADVTVGHMAMLHGCTVGEGSLIGIKAVVLNHARIGRECLIGAGALNPEVREIPGRSRVIGAPGKVVREMSPEQAMRVALGAAHYVENWKRYRRELTEMS